MVEKLCDSGCGPHNVGLWGLCKDETSRFCQHYLENNKIHNYYFLCLLKGLY